MVSSATQSFSQLGPCPQLPSGFIGRAAPEGISPVWPAAKERKGSQQPRAGNPAHRPEQVQYNDADENQKLPDDDRERMALDAIVKLRSLCIERRLRDATGQKEACDALASLEDAMRGSFRTVLTAYAAGGLFYTSRVLQQLPRGPYAPSAPTKGPGAASLRRLVLASFKALRQMLEAGAVEDAVDMIRNYGVVDVAGQGIKVHAGDAELHLVALELLHLLLERAAGHDVEQQVEADGLHSVLAGLLLSYARSSSSVSEEDAQLRDQALVLTLKVCRHLVSAPKHGPRAAMGIAAQRKWTALQTLLELVDCTGDGAAGFDTIALEVESQACSLALCMVAQSSVVANKVSCMQGVKILVKAVRRHSHDKESMQWLKGALLNIDGCRVRGNLHDRPQTVSTMLTDTSGRRSAVHMSERPSPFGRRREEPPPRIADMTASEFAWAIIRDAKRKQSWLRQIDDFVKEHAPGASTGPATPSSPSQPRARKPGPRAWTPWGVSPYALPVLPAFFQEQERQKDEEKPKAHKSHVLQQAVRASAEDIRASRGEAVRQSTTTLGAAAGRRPSTEAAPRPRKTKAKPKKRQQKEAGSSEEDRDKEVKEGQGAQGDGEGAAKEAVRKEGAGQEEAKKMSRKRQRVQKARLESYGLVPDEATADLWQRKQAARRARSAGEVVVNPLRAKPQDKLSAQARRLQEEHRRQHRLERQQQAQGQQLCYTAPTVAHSLEDIAKRLLGDPPSEAYTSSIPTVLDKHKPELDKLSYAERLQVMLLSVERSIIEHDKVALAKERERAEAAAAAAAAEAARKAEKAASPKVSPKALDPRIRPPRRKNVPAAGQRKEEAVETAVLAAEPTVQATPERVEEPGQLQQGDAVGHGQLVPATQSSGGLHESSRGEIILPDDVSLPPTTSSSSGGPAQSSVRPDSSEVVPPSSSSEVYSSDTVTNTTE